MTITLEIRAEVQAALARQAAVHGRALEAYAASMLEEAAHVPAGASHLIESKLETTFLEMAQLSHKIAVLPDEAFTRESLYLDHD